MARGHVVYYCANVGGRSVAQADPAAAWRINAEVPACIAGVAGHFVHFSSDYVFSSVGTWTESSPVCPLGAYAHSKAEGEVGVLRASPRSLVVRVSGLYDAEGTRAVKFPWASAIAAADDRVTSPTYVPDLISVVQAWQRDGAHGIRHVCGPDAISEYEFYQLGSVRWGLPVRPVLSGEPRWGVVLQPSKGGMTRSVTSVFGPAASDARKRRCHKVIVFDCVGAVLGGRRWREPDPCFWKRVDSDPNGALREYGAERLANAFAPNPRLWPKVQIARQHGRVVLANNGPWESFSIWQRKYGFAGLFDEVINSERHGLVKAGPEFREHINRLAAHQRVVLVDDRAAIVSECKRAGWDGRLTSRLCSWPIDEFDCEGSGMLWKESHPCQ